MNRAGHQARLELGEMLCYMHELQFWQLAFVLRKTRRFTCTTFRNGTAKCNGGLTSDLSGWRASTLQAAWISILDNL